MKATIFFIFILCCIIGLTCKQISFKKYIKNDFIVFGSGGGFTGETQEFFLLSNGDLRQKNSFSTDTVHIKKHSFQTVKKIFKLADSKTIKSIHLKSTGNITHFIKFYKNKSLENSYSWSDESIPLPTPLNKLNTELNNLK